MLNWFSRSSPHKRAATDLYAAIMAQSRLPHFYAGLGVPDTIGGRFEMLVLHMFLVLRRLRKDGASSEPVAQALSEAFVADMDDVMREMGVSDISVAKKMYSAAGAYLGRLKAYDAALDSGDPQELAAALAEGVGLLGRERAGGRVGGGHLGSCGDRISSVRRRTVWWHTIMTVTNSNSSAAAPSHELDAPPWLRVESTLMATANAIRAAYDQRLGPLGLNLSVASLLAYIRDFGPVTQTRAAEHLDQGRAVTGTQVDKLQALGLVERLPDPDDRRVWLVAVTDAGRELAARVDDVDAVLRAELRAGITRADRQSLAGLLVRLQHNLRTPGSHTTES